MQKMTGVIQNYAWGSLSAIPQILGTAETGEPQAEYWLGAHTSAPSDVDGTKLDALLSEHPDIIGSRSVARFGDRLPYLLKVLAADSPLSLQAHPTRAQAEEGFARENEAGVAPDDPKRTYRDDWPKPELMMAISSFDALCGFRDPHRTAELFESFGIAELDQMVAPLRLRGGSAGLAEVFLDALSRSPERTQLTTELVARAVNHVDDEGDFGDLCRVAVMLDEHYPGDSSILAALMTNHITLEPGQAVFLPAGNLHAYLKGSGIEIMANSDNVLRGGLTAKHIDVDELVSVLEFDAAPIDLVLPQEQAPGLKRYPTPAPEFALWQVLPTPDTSVELPATDSARILLVTEGHLVDTEGLELHQGEAGFLPAGEQAAVRGDAVAYLASPGL